MTEEFKITDISLRPKASSISLSVMTQFTNQIRYLFQPREESNSDTGKAKTAKLVKITCHNS